MECIERPTPAKIAARMIKKRKTKKKDLHLFLQRSFVFALTLNLVSWLQLPDQHLLKDALVASHRLTQHCTEHRISNESFGSPVNRQTFFILPHLNLWESIVSQSCACLYLWTSYIKSVSLGSTDWYQHSFPATSFLQKEWELEWNPYFLGFCAYLSLEKPRNQDI